MFFGVLKTRKFSQISSIYFKLVLVFNISLFKNEIEYDKTKNRKIDVTSFKLISMNLSSEKKKS